jgi:hypothetical protein
MTYSSKAPRPRHFVSLRLWASENIEEFKYYLSFIDPELAGNLGPDFRDILETMSIRWEPRFFVAFLDFLEEKTNFCYVEPGTDLKFYSFRGDLMYHLGSIPPFVPKEKTISEDAKLIPPSGMTWEKLLVWCASKKAVLINADAVDFKCSGCVNLIPWRNEDLVQSFSTIDNAYAKLLSFLHLGTPYLIFSRRLKNAGKAWRLIHSIGKECLSCGNSKAWNDVLRLQPNCYSYSTASKNLYRILKDVLNSKTLDSVPGGAFLLRDNITPVAFARTAKLGDTLVLREIQEALSLYDTPVPHISHNIASGVNQASFMTRYFPKVPDIDYNVFEEGDSTHFLGSLFNYMTHILNKEYLQVWITAFVLHVLGDSGLTIFPTPFRMQEEASADVDEVCLTYLEKHLWTDVYKSPGLSAKELRAKYFLKGHKKRDTSKALSNLVDKGKFRRENHDNYLYYFPSSYVGHV